MPPCLDVYVVVADRSVAQVEAFVAEYVDPAVSVGSLSVVPVGYQGALDDLALEDWETFDPPGLAEALAFGFGDPRRAFTMYLAPMSMAFDQVLVGFARGGSVTLGLSLDDPFNSPDRRDDARRLADELLATYEGELAWFAAEEPPVLLDPSNPPGRALYVTRATQP